MSNYSKALEEMKRRRQEEAEQKTAPSSLLSKAQPEKKDYSKALELMRRQREYNDKMATVNVQRAERQQEWINTRTQDVIKAELDEAKKNDGDAKLLSGEWWRDIGEEASAIFDYNKQKQITTDRTENAKRVEELTKELNERKAYDYNLLTQNKDFEAKSKYVANKDNFYGYINRDPEATERYISTATMEVPGVFREYFGMSEPQAEHMTEDEISLYNYIYATKGKDSADEYYEYLRPTLNARYTNQKDIETEEYGKLHPGKAAAKSVLTNVGGLTTSFVPTALDLFGQEIDPNDPIFRTKRDTEKLISGGAQTIKENYGGVTSFLYEQSVSMANNLTARAISYLSGNLMPATLQFALTTAQDKTLDAIERGVDQNTAIMMGLPAGIIEAACENLSLESFGNRFLNNVTSNKWWKDWIIQTFTEAGEELATSVATRITDTVIAMGESEFMLAVNQYKQAGMSDGQAIGRVLLDNMKEDVLAALGGAISGFVFGGGGVAISEGPAAIGKAAADTSSKLRGQEILRGAQNSEVAQQQRAEQQKFTVLPTAVEQERAKARERGEVFDVGYERPYTGYANTAADDELDARVNAAQTVTEKTGIRYGASEKQISAALELSKALGRDVEFFNQKSADGKPVVDGFYSNENGHIYLNVNAVKKLETTISHELVHSFEGTPIYDELETYVMLEYERRGKSFDAEVARLTKTYEDAGRYQGEEAVKHDMVANFVEKYVLGSKRSIKEITKSKPSVARRMLAWLSNVLKKLERTSVSSDVFDEIEKIINEFDDAEASSTEEAPTNVGEENVATATENEVNADEEVVAENKTPATEVSERSQGKAEKETAAPKETKKASERETAKTTVKESVRIAEADDMLAEAEAAYDAGEITEEELDATREVYDLWYETGTKPSESGSGWNDGKIARGVKRLLGDKLEYSVSYTTDNRPVAVIDEDILVGVDEADIVKTVKRELGRRFSDGIWVSGRNIAVNRTSRLEYTGSKYSNKLKHQSKEVFVDKMRAAANLDDIVLASTDYINEELKHSRRDEFTQFAKGDVLLQINNNKYTANVVVGITDDSETVLYDVVNVQPTNFQLKTGTTNNRELQNTALVRKVAPADTTISHSVSEVKTTDEDVTQMQQFKRWFGDWQNHPESASKVVNEDGTPKVMYHGTNANDEFWVFDTYGSNFGLFGMGSYFTDNYDVAQGYTKKGKGKNPRIYAVYLNIRNPIDMDQTADKEQWLAAVEEDDRSDLEQYAKNAVTNEDMYKCLKELCADNMMYKEDAIEYITNVIQSMGFDGITHIGGGRYNSSDSERHRVYIAFEPNQIKSATDNIGTFDSNNPDIRYSVSETDAVEGVDVVASLPSKAKSALRTVERKIGISMAEALNLDLGGESGKYQTQEFRNFLADVVRPLTEEYLETGEISSAAVRNMFEDNYEDIPGMPKSMYTTQKANDLSAFEKAINDNWNELRNIRRYAEDAKREKVMRVTTPITTAEAKERFKALKDAQRFEAKVVRNNLLTEEDNLKVGELLRGETIIGNLTDGKYNIDGIKAVYEAKLQTKEAADAVSKYKQQVAASRRENAETLLEGSDKWKDKGNGFAYARETIERNIVDVTNDKATADKLIREIAYPVHESEAKSTKWKDEMKARVKALNLSTKVKKGNTVSESYAVQFYGEASENIKIIEASRGRIDKRDGYTAEEWKAALEAMWQENPVLYKAKIERAVEEFRAIYEEIFEIMNDVRIRNGYAPVEYRKGYFPHFTGDEEGVLAKFGRALGIKTEMMKLPTTINGMTGTFKPGITWFGHAQSRQGIYTTYDAVTGFEQYINGAADVIFHTDNIQNLRALATMIRYNASEESIKAKIVDVLSDDSLDDAAKEAVLADIRSNGKYRLSQFVSYLDEYTNLLANKKSKLDRGVEELFGRKIYVVVKNLESKVAANMVALNLGSALTNYIPINQAGAQLGWRWMLQGMGQTVSNYAKADGIDDISTFIINRHGSDPLVRTFLEKASDVASKPMELVDNFTTGTIVRAAYAKYLHSGMTETEAMYQADLFAASVMADRSKGSMPTIFSSKNPLTKLFTQFQLEVNNEFSVIFKDIPRRERKKWTDAVAIVLLNYFIGAFFYNELYERIVGRRAAFDPIGIIKGAYEDFKRGDSFGDATKEALTEIGGNLPFVGGVLFEGGRIPISSALPDVETLLKASLSDWSAEKKRKTIGKELLAPLYYVAFPFGGGAVKKLNESISIIKNGGRYTFDSEGNRMLQYPFYKGEGLSTFKEGAKALMFGGTSTEAGREWVESDFGKLGAIETATYQSLIEAGMSSRKAHDFINDMREIEAPGVETKTENYEYLGIKVQHEVPVDPDAEVKTKAQLKREMLENSDLTGEQKSIVYFALMASDLEQVLMTELEGLGADMGEATDVLLNMKDAANTYEKMEILLNSDLRSNAKEWIYTDRISESRIEDIEAFAEAGMDFDTFIRANMEYNRIYNEDLSASEKATALARWINQNGFDAEEKAVIEEAFKYYSMMPAKAGKYDDFTESGLDDETAYKLSSALSDLEPLEGKTSVSELQKCRAVIDTIGSPTEQMKALESVMNKSNYKKCVTAGSYGVDAETYVAFREALEAGDKDGNGSISQAEAEAALDKLSGNLSDGERWLIELTGGSMPGVVYLSNTQLAVLWQLANPSWNPKNNPYSKSVGQTVQDLIK